MSKGSKEVDSRSFDVGQMPDIPLPANGEIRTNSSIEFVGENLTNDYADALAFMEEEIEVVVHETTDQNAPPVVHVGNNGVFFQFTRGVPTIAKRKFVDCLIVKGGRVTTPEFINGGGERSYAIRQASAHVYPFSIIRDRNPKGAEWLRQRLAQAV